MASRFLLFVVAASGALSVLGAGVKSVESGNTIILDNGFTKVEFDTSKGSLTGLYADFHGTGAYGASVLASPFETITTSGADSACSAGKRSSGVVWSSKTEALQSFTVRGVNDCSINPLISEDWSISLQENNRFVSVSVSGKTLRTGQVKSVTHSLFLNTLSVYGLFDRGVAQMMGDNGLCLGSNQSIGEAYFIGNSFALDLKRDKSVANSQIVLHSSGSASNGVSFGSGFEEVILGTYPNLSSQLNQAWKKCWGLATDAVDVTGTETWSRSYSLGPNNYDFPLRALPSDAAAENLPFFDLQTYLTGLYGSPAGCLQSYYDDQTGIIAPTISHPDIGYDPDTNFFDPDNFISVSAMMHSGDPYLLNEVKQVLLRTGETMCGIGSDQLKSYCDLGRQRIKHIPMHVPRFHGPKPAAQTHHNDNAVTNLRRADANSKSPTASADRTGQLMHHFISLKPTYESIAGSEQLGPNIFWTWSVLRYVSISQDRAFAEQLLPYIDLSTKFLLTFFDESYDLIYAPGPLWIDVLVRENYTSDSAPIFVPLLNLIADFYDYLGEDAEFSALLRDVTSRLTVSINKYLWDTTSDDHFFTQLNPDGTTRDFIDYDSNLLTVAFNIVDKDRLPALLNRVDNGPHTHIRATWCSEIKYSGDADDCYIVGGTTCGDSVVTLARIGWVDALARKQVGDLDTFNNLLLLPLQNDLVKDVWLYERYDENGTQIRTSYYFEYPALVTMMLREVRYGIDVGVSSVTIQPFPLAAFNYRLGVVTVLYSQTSVTLQFPGDTAQVSPKTVRVYGMLPQQRYTLAASGDCISSNAAVTAATADANGLLQFTWAFTDGCTLVATAATHA